MSVFHFKEFDIVQERSTMKVGTDSVLLGSWLYSIAKPRRMLDVGCGTGLLSLMYAQANKDAQITAIEIDKDSYEEACINITNSKWAECIKLVHCDAKRWKPSIKFDLLLSNPPYFSNSLLSPKSNKNTARHQQSFNLHDLIELWGRIGEDKSFLACVLPVVEAKKLIEIAESQGYFLEKCTWVKPKSFLKENRALLLFSSTYKATSFSSIVIRNLDGTYTDEFKELTSMYYLKL